MQPDHRWCILRTAGQRTMPLLNSLTEAGFKAWTPIVTVKRRLPRRRERVEALAPLMPTFVFVAASHLPELVRIARALSSKHPEFSIFKFDGRVPVLADHQLEQLRLAEKRSVPTRRRPTIAPGTTVKPGEGAYAGLEGVVKRSDGKYTLVAFGGWMDVQIETLLLTGDQVGTDRACMATAA